MSRLGASAKSTDPRPPARAEPAPDDGDEGALLLSTVTGVPSTLRGLFEHQALLDPEALADVERTLAGVEQRLAQKQLQVVVTGEQRSGKSTLLDAIVGDRLLSGARGELAVVTFLRRHDVPSYRARFASGAEDDFTRRVPDHAKALDELAAKLEQESAELQRRCQAARWELGRAKQTRGRAELEVEDALGEANRARELALAANTALADAEHAAASHERNVAALELELPGVVRSSPSRWAFWLWLWYALYLLWRGERVRRYRLLLSERERTRAQVERERETATQATGRLALAEARLQPLDRDAEHARAHSGELERCVSDSVAEQERLRGELDALRSEREHCVSERWRRFFSDLNALSKRTDLVELRIDYPAKLLPEDVTIIDIPGMLAESSPAWELVREHADGCILVSELDRGVSQAAKLFLRQLRDIVPHVLLVLTKMDQAYERVTRRGDADPWEQVEHAQNIGTRRFARELGRAPDRVLSVCVAAESLLSARGSELAARSERELDKLFVLLHRERALILGAHAARAIRRCIAGVADAETRAERGYRERILELESKRTPEPAAFRRQVLTAAEPAMLEAARDALAAAVRTLDDHFLVLTRLCEQTFATGAKRDAWLERATDLAQQLSLGAAAACSEALRSLEAGIERGVIAIERGSFEALRERYQLLHEVRRTVSSSPRLGAPELEPPSFAHLIVEVRSDVERSTKQRWAFAAFGMTAGATSGALLHPWLGPIFGAALGGCGSLLRGEGALCDRVLKRFEAALRARQELYRTELASLEANVTESIHAALERSLERAMIRFARFIAEPLEAERQVIDNERAKLADLETLRGRLNEHDAELERLLEAGRRASFGLCRANPV